MSVPVRCYTCGKILACFEEPYAEKLESGSSRKEALDSLGLTRDCCRNIMMSTVDHLANIMPHSVPFYDSDSDTESKKQPIKTWRKKTEDKPSKKTEDKPPKKTEDKPKKTEDKPKKTEDKPKKTEDKPPKKTEDKPKKTEDKPPKKTEDKPSKKTEDKPSKKTEDKPKKTEDKPPKKTDKLKNK
jgi:DNA-directed RNA polymerase subunit N (RpoN/RPB10)